MSASVAAPARSQPRSATLELSLGGALFAAFAAEYIVHTKGRWAKRPFYLEPWQLEIESEMLKTSVHEEGIWIDLGKRDLDRLVRHPDLFYDDLRHEIKKLDTEPGHRLVREAYIQEPKKTGKSTKSSAHALYFLCADGEEGAEVYSAATARDQARIVFEQARQMVLASPSLQDYVKPYRYHLAVERTNSVYRVLSADAGVQEGLNPHASVIDELHRHKNRDLYDVLTSGDVARENPFTLNITNPGTDPNTICGELYAQAKRVARGEPGARRDLFAYVPELPPVEVDYVLERLRAHVEDGEPLDREALRLAKLVNEASWIGEDAIVRDFRRFPQHVFKRRRLNTWTQAEKDWLPPGTWEACLSDLELVEGQDVVCGIDLGQKRDTTARIVAGRVDGRIVVRAQAWGVRPKDAQLPDPPVHDLVEGEKVNFDVMENDVRDLAREYELFEACYDPWRFERSAQDLADEGLAMVEYPQTNERMCPATQATYDAIIDGTLAHNGDPVLRAHIEAAVARETGRGVRLSKKDATRPCDLAIALVMVVGRLLASEQVGSPDLLWLE